MSFLECTVVNMQDSAEPINDSEAKSSDNNSGQMLRDTCQGSVSDDDAGGWAVIARRKKREPNKQPENKHKPGTSLQQASTSQSVAVHIKPPTTRKKKVFGNNASKDSAMKTGVKIVQKSVVHIDNLSPDCTEALLKDYLLSEDVRVLSCYTAKSWLRDEEKEQVSAFRVCVPAEHRHLLFNPQLWSPGVINRLEVQAVTKWQWGIVCPLLHTTCTASINVVAIYHRSVLTLT